MCRGHTRGATCRTRSKTRRARVVARPPAWPRSVAQRPCARSRGRSAAAIARTRARPPPHLQIMPARARRPLVLLMTEASVGGRAIPTSCRPSRRARLNSIATHRVAHIYGRDINLRPPASALLARPTDLPICGRRRRRPLPAWRRPERFDTLIDDDSRSSPPAPGLSLPRAWPTTWIKHNQRRCDDSSPF